MPELPEVEITARRLSSALKGAEVESALAPGMVAMKTFEPPLEALEGRTVRWNGGEGRAAGLDESGALLVDTEAGGVTLAAGEVHLGNSC